MAPFLSCFVEKTNHPVDRLTRRSSDIWKSLSPKLCQSQFMRQKWRIYGLSNTYPDCLTDRTFLEASHQASASVAPTNFLHWGRLIGAASAKPEVPPR